MEKTSFYAGDSDEPAGEEQCQCDCDSKRALLQNLQESQDKVKALEENNKRISERLKTQETFWRDEKDGLVRLLDECENNLNEKKLKAQELEEKLSRAECALEHLTKSKGELIEEVSRRDLEMQQLVGRLSQAEFELQCLQKDKGDNTHLLSAALQTKSRALEDAQISLSEKDNLIHHLSDQLQNLQEVRQNYFLLEKDCSEKARELQLLVESQNMLKHDLHIAEEEHKKQMAAITCKLQESLDSNSLKESKIEAITNDLQRLQLTLSNIRDSKANTELEANKLKEELAVSHEIQLSSQIVIDNSVKEIASLKASLLEKDEVITNLKSQRFYREEEDHHQMESIIKELQEHKSMNVNLRKMLEESQRQIAALEDLRKRDIEVHKEKETSWMKEREEILENLNSLHDDLTIKEAITKELKEKLSCAEDAMNSLSVSKSLLLQEVSELKSELKQLCFHLKDSESTIDFAEKSENEDLTNVHELLAAKTKEIETLQNDLVQHQRQIASMNEDIISLREIQLVHASCGDVLKRKEEELNAISLYQEAYKHQLNNLQEEYHKKTENMAAELDKALEYKSITTNRLDELNAQLERMNVALDRAQTSKEESKAEVEKVLATLGGIQEEKLMLLKNLQTLEFNNKKEVEELRALLSRKEVESFEFKQQIDNLERALSHAMQQEQEWRDEEAKQGALIREFREKTSQYSEIYKLHQNELSKWSEKENSWLTERESMISQIEMVEKKLTNTERNLEVTSSGFDALKSSYERLEKKLALTEEENAQLLVQLDEVNVKFEVKNRESKTLEENLLFASSNLTALLQEKESVLAQSKEKIDTMESEMFLKSEENDKLRSETASLTEEVRMHQQRIEDLEQHIYLLKASLSQKEVEIKIVTENKESLEEEYIATTEELELAKAKIESYKEDLRNYKSVSDQKLQQNLVLMQNKEEEFSQLLTRLEDRECMLKELNATIITLEEENGVLKLSATALQEKVDILVLENNNGKFNTEKLFSIIEEKEATIALKVEELDSLSRKLQNSLALNDSITKYEEKIKELEETVAEGVTCLQEREERLIASEWAVQQLANEVSKVKNTLARKEREEMFLQNRLSDAENHLKAKETELMDMDCYVQNLLKKNASKQSEVEKLSQAFSRMQEKEGEWKMEQEKLEAEIQRISGLLDAKIGEMSSTDEQIKQKLEKENMMEAAIQSLKSQLAHHAELLEEERSKSELLHQELEASRNNESLAVNSLRGSESKLVEAEKLFKEQAQRLQANLSKAEEELVDMSSKQKELETDLLAALQEVLTLKEKSFALSQVVAEKDNTLKDLQQQFDILQENFEEQKMLVHDKDVELTSTVKELKCYIDKERTLTKNVSLTKAQLEEVKTHLQKMEEQNTSLGSRVDTMATEILAKTDEIEILKQNQKNVETSLNERESHVNELQGELDLSIRALHEKEAEINVVKQSLNSAEIDLMKVREDIHNNHDTFDKALTRLYTAEENCRTLDLKMNSMQEQFEAAIVAFQNQFDMELKAKYEVFERSNAEWECTVDKLNSELEAYCRKEMSVEVLVAALMNTVTGIQFLLTNDEGFLALKTMFSLENEDLSQGLEIQDRNMETIANFNSNYGPAPVHSENSKSISKLLELHTVMQELQLEQFKRKSTESIVVQKMEDSLCQLFEKENQIRELELAIQSHKGREEEYREWIQEFMNIHFELEKEVRMAMSLTSLTGLPESQMPQLHSDITMLRSQVTASNQEINQLCGMWRCINEAHQEYMLSTVRSLNQELESNSIFGYKYCDGQAGSSVFTRELQKEFARLKLAVISSIQERDSQLADALAKADALQRSLQENNGERMVEMGMLENLKRMLQQNADKGRDAQVNISELQLLLLDSLKQLDRFKCDNLPSIDFHSELGISPAEEEESDAFPWTVNLKQAFLLAEKLNQHIKFVERERDEKLAEWMDKAQSAASQNHILAKELAVLKHRLESTQDMEQLRETELRNWKGKAETITDAASNLKLELSKACSALDDLKLCIKSKEEELSFLQSSLETANGRKQIVDEKLALATDQINDLLKEVGDLKDKQIPLEKELERLREMELLACHDKVTLQSELSTAQKTAQQLENVNAMLQSELTAAQTAIGRLEDGKNQLEQELYDMHVKEKLRVEENIALMSQIEDVSNLEKKLEVAGRENSHLQDLCQRLKADVTSVQESRGHREGVLKTALAKVRESSSKNRILIESKLQALYESLTSDDDDTEPATSRTPGKENTSLASSKIELEGDEFDWDRYLQLCDSIIRRHSTLEKQLETLEASASGQRHTGGKISPSARWALTPAKGPREDEQMEVADTTEGRENRRKSKRGEMSTGLESFNCRDGSRIPLQPVLSQVGTPSPCAKRHRSSSSLNRKSQNDPLQCTSLVSRGVSAVSPAQKSLSFSEN